MRLLFSIALLGLGLLAPLQAGAAAAEPSFPLTGPFDLVADELEYERDRDLYVARGHVRITQTDRTLTADWVSLSNATGIGVASGDVVITQGGDTLRASFVQFDVQTLHGVLFDGELDSEQSRFRMAGREVRRTGEQTYRFEDGRFTTCRCPEPGRDPWSIQADRADLEIGGYGTARNTTFEVLDVPVLWVPWMIYPLKTERQTGFLFPELNATTRSGGDVGLPFFWAVSDALNVTLTPSWIFERGFKPRAEVEYVIGEHSEGRAFASFVSDRDIDSDDPSTPFDRQRWAAEWQHDHFLPREWRLKLDARALSDNLYPLDFKELSEHRADRFLESTGFVGGHLGRADRFGVVGAVQVVDDLQSPDDLDRDDFLLQRAPQVTLSALPQGLAGLPLVVSRFDLRYSNFRPADRAEQDLRTAAVVGDHLFLDTGIDARPSGAERDAAGLLFPEGGAFDGSADDFDALLRPFGTEGDGLYQEGEPLADVGHRVVVAPRVGVPLRIADLLEFYPEVGYHGTFYQTREQGFEQRSLVTGQLDLRGRLRREFALPFGGGRAVHLFEPRLGWALVTDASQSGKPLFVPETARPQDRIRELELGNVVSDPADRIEAFNGIVLGFGNRVLRPGQGSEGARLWADVTLAAQYDFSDDEFGLLVLEGRLHPRERTVTRFHVSYDPEQGRLSESLVQAGWSHAAGHELVMGYRYLREIPLFYEAYLFDDERFDRFEDDFDRVDQLFFGARAALTPNWALTYRGAFDFDTSVVLANEGGVEYVSRCRCWAIRLEVDQDRSSGIGFGLRYRLIGLGDDTARPFERGRGVRGIGGFLDDPSGV